MSSKIRWGHIIWKLVRVTFKLMLVCISAMIEIGCESNRKIIHPFGKIEARSREERGEISNVQFSNIMNDQ